MNVSKIEIKQELMSIQDGRQEMTFAILPPLSVTTFRENGEIPDTDVVARQVIYKVERVWNGNEYLNYLVKKDDRDVFNDLVKLSADDLEALIKKRTEVLEKNVQLAREHAIQEIRDARWHVSMSIKKLPWYSRLLNNF